MDSLNADYPNTIKYIDNNFDSSSKLDSAFPGKIIFKSECYIKDPKNYNNINKIDKESNQRESFSNFKDIGPYKDTPNRALRYGPKKYGYSPQTCSEATQGFKYFSLQDNGWCAADNDYNHATKYGESNRCIYGKRGIRNGGKLGGPWCNYIFENIDNTKIWKDKYKVLEKNIDKYKKNYRILLEEKNMINKKYRNEIEKQKNLEIKENIIKKFNENNLEKLQKNIYNDNNQMNTNNNIIEPFNNSNSIDELIEYNQLLTEKQKVQKDKIELIKQKEENLNKVNASLKSGNDRNSFKRKIIYTLVALIFFLFILSLSTYIYFVRDFKVPK